MSKSLSIEGRDVPIPTYDRDVVKLTNAYKKGLLQIRNKLERTDTTDLSRAQSAALMTEITEALKEIDLFAIEWIEKNIPIAATDGAAATLVNLGLAKTIDEAQKIVDFNKLNKDLVELHIADMQDDVLAITDRIKKKVRNTIRRVSAETTRLLMAQGVDGLKAQKREMLQSLRKELGSSIDTAIVDAASRKWKATDYVDMLTRTKLQETFRQAQTNEAIARDAFYAVITRHGAKDACRFHEGRIIKLVATAPGNYPTYDELKQSQQIFHPRCRHSFSVRANLDRMSEESRIYAEKQQKRGNAALATGKRNPKDIE